MTNRVRSYLEMVQIQHTVFALPFALAGAALGAQGRPSMRALSLAVVAVAGLRTAAMSCNRLADRRFDALNPRTAGRALVTGEITPWGAVVLLGGGLIAFMLASAALGRPALLWAPLFIALALGYSATKRFTSSSHVFLGAALSLAPFGGWLATAADPRGYPWTLSLGVALWVAGFDIVYSCQDEAIDRELGLHSLPAKLGRRRALAWARRLHGLAFLAFLATGAIANLGWPFAIGLAVVAVALMMEHRAVSAADLSRLHFAFFTLNSVVSVALFASVVAGLALRS